ncbi:flavodoxin [Alkalimonas collagenimarina]|uniref:Flavodoxin n=1 Tax=Alkalimonas collagenimarina TaxID=400390 RepID=A0ABT9GV33_9GAMM|nr:flavodoxin [Alkalimonas collagenimarina]MDP4534917.1 flavodoxin [Alkalimonas collagenimarina]
MKKIALVVGTVYGGAQYVAEQADAELQQRGYGCRLFLDPKLDDVLAYNADIWLVITSTTGQGDIPDNVQPFFLEARDRFPLLTDKHYLVIGLGDSSYDTFCGAGKQFVELLQELQGKPLAEPLWIDACETLEPEGIALPWLAQHLPAQ